MCTQIDRDISVGIDTGVHTDRQGPQCGYRQVYRIDIQGHKFGYKHRWTKRYRGTPVCV